MKSWTRAKELARQTPPSRNRFVDFLRAVSITAVVLGHWTAAAPYMSAEGKMVPTHLLAVSPWTHWLTWVIQVMPIFFLVGGYSNGISWRAARREGRGYAEWLDGRLRRLVGPVLPLLLTWALLGGSAAAGGVGPEMIRIGSQMALIPIWFLAVYVLVILLVPLSHAAWERYGSRSFWFLAGAGLALDFVFYRAPDLRWTCWSNYLFVWLAVHQLGYAWRDGRFANPRVPLAFGVAGLAVLFALVRWGPYPISMVGVPGDDVSNTLPPKLTMLVLGIAQGGLLLALEAPARRLLAGVRPWAATVLVNGTIMTVYLWHLTAMTLLIGLSFYLGGTGLHLAPASPAWWAARPLWLVLLALALLPFVALLGRFERPRARTAPPVAAWRLVLGALLVCTGLALLALKGVAGDGLLGLRLEVLALPFVGAALARPWGAPRAHPS